MKYAADEVKGIGIDQFRQAVNYADMVKDDANRTEKANKGYVRFAGFGRSVSIEKVNNWVDVFINQSININKTNNLLIRRQFLSALRPELQLLPKDKRARIENMILRGSGSRQASTEGLDAKPLSRREIAAVFKAFDEGFNSPAGRRSVLMTFLGSKANELSMRLPGGEPDIDRFCQKVLHLENAYAFVDKYADALKADPNATDAEKISGKGMLMDEADFHGLLITLNQLADSEITVYKTEEKFADTVLGWVGSAVKGGFGFELDNDTRTAWRAALKPLADSVDMSALVPKDSKGVPIVGCNYNDKLLDLFVDRILVHELKSVLENVFELGLQNEDAETQRAAVGSCISYEAIERLALDFFTRATDKDFVDTVVKFAADKGDDQQLAKTKGAVNKLIDNFLSIGSKARIVQDAGTQVMRHAAVKAVEAMKIGSDIGKLVDVFSTDARLEWFAKKFIFDRYPHLNEKEDPGLASVSVCKGMFAQADKTIDKAVVAAQLVNGIRITVYGGGNKVSSVKQSKGGMEDFALRILDALTTPEALKALKCSREEICEFASLTFPNVFAQIRNELLAVREGKAAETNLFSDDNFNAVVTRLKSGYSSLRKQLAGFDKSSAKTVKSLTGKINAQVKIGRLTPKRGKELLFGLKVSRDLARSDAARELAMLMPLDASNESKARWVMTDVLNQFVAKENSRLASLLLDGSWGFLNVMDLKTDANVCGTLAAWKEKNGALVDDPHGLNLVTSEEVESRLLAPLADAFEKTIVAKIPKNSKDITEDTVKAVKKSFAAVVDDRVSAIRKYTALFTRKVESFGKEILTAMMKEKSEGNPWSRYAKLPAKERETLAGEIVRAAMLSRRSDIREVIFDIVDHPDKYSSGQVKEDVFDRVLETKSFSDKTLEVLFAREEEFDRWLDGGNFRKGLEADLFGVYSKDAQAAGVTESELVRIIQSNGNGFFAQAGAKKAVWAGLGRARFYDEASEAVNKDLQARIKEFSDYKRLFEAEASKIEAGFGNMDGMEKIRAEFLLGLAGEKLNKNELKAELALYRQRLRAELDTTIGGIKEDFKFYRSAFIISYKNVHDHFNRKFKDEVLKIASKFAGGMDGLGADAEEWKSYVTDAYLSFFNTQIDYAIARDPEAYAISHDLSEKVDDELTNWFGSLVRKLRKNARQDQERIGAGAIADANGGDWDRIDALLDRLGYGYYLSPGNAITEGLRRHVNTFMSGGDFKKLHEDALKASVERSLAALTGGMPSKASQDAIAAYDAAVKAQVETYLTTVSNIDNLMADKDLAYARIELELNARQVPDIKDPYGKTVRDRSHEFFAKALKDEADAMIEASKNGTKFESMLNSPKKMDEFIGRIEHDCYTTKTANWVSEMSNRLFNEVILGESDTSMRRTLFVYEGNADTAGDRLMSDVVMDNRNQMLGAITSFIVKLTRRYQSYAAMVAAGAMDHLDDQVRQLADKELGGVYSASYVRCQFVEGFDHALETAVESFEEILIRWAFATPVDAKPPFKSLNEFLDAKPEDLEKLCTKNVPKNFASRIMDVQSGEKWATNRMALKGIVASFRNGVLKNARDALLDGKLPKLNVVDHVTNYGNDFLQDTLHNPESCLKQKRLINAFADELGDLFGINIARGGNRVVNFFSNLFKGKH